MFGSCLSYRIFVVCVSLSFFDWLGGYFVIALIWDRFGFVFLYFLSFSLCFLLWVVLRPVLCCVCLDCLVVMCLDCAFTFTWFLSDVVLISDRIWCWFFF